MQMHQYASLAVIYVIQSSLRLVVPFVCFACVCVSEGNMPLSCAGPLADNGRVWGENYQRHISSVWDNALL